MPVFCHGKTTKPVHSSELNYLWGLWFHIFPHPAGKKLSLIFKPKARKDALQLAFCHMFQFHKFGLLFTVSTGVAIFSTSAWRKACFLLSCSRKLTKAPGLSDRRSAACTPVMAFSFVYLKNAAQAVSAQVALTQGFADAFEWALFLSLATINSLTKKKDSVL